MKVSSPFGDVDNYFSFTLAPWSLNHLIFFVCFLNWRVSEVEIGDNRGRDGGLIASTVLL